jgi:hypothetical protein
MQSEVNETAPALPRRVLDVGNDDTNVVYLIDNNQGDGH